MGDKAAATKSSSVRIGSLGTARRIVEVPSDSGKRILPALLARRVELNDLRRAIGLLLTVAISATRIVVGRIALLAFVSVLL